jgi:hypothetical protein
MTGQKLQEPGTGPIETNADWPTDTETSYSSARDWYICGKTEGNFVFPDGKLFTFSPTSL